MKRIGLKFLAFSRTATVRAMITSGFIAVGVASAAELTISDGVVVKFGPDAQLVVRDKITIGKNTIFTSQKDDTAAGQTDATAQVPAPGDWRGIRLEKSSLPFAPQIGENLTVRYAGAADSAALTLRGVKPTLTYPQFTDNLIGLRTLQVASPQITGASFLRNGIGLEVDDNSAPIISTSQFSQNTTSAVLNKTPSTMVQATGNWWGHLSGPKEAVNNPQGQGDVVSTGVTYDQFLTQAPVLNPTIELAAPASYIEQSSVAVNISCLNATEYRIAENGAFVGVNFQPLANGQASVNVPLSSGDGTKQLSVQFRNASGTIVTANLNGGVLVDTQAPQIAITNPAAGSVIMQSITVEASVTDTVGIAKVDFYIDDQLAATRTTTPYSFAWNINNVAIGEHTIKVVATDKVGRVAEESRTVTVASDPNAPTVVSKGLPTANYSASSTYDGSAYSAFNGGGWNSGTFSGTLTVDLGAQYKVSRVTHIPGIRTTSNATSETRREEVSVSLYPNGPWTTAYSQSVFAQSGVLRDITFTPVAGRYVRLSIPSSASWVSLSDVQVFGAPTEVPLDTTGPSISAIKFGGATLSDGATLTTNGTVSASVGDPSGVSKVELLLDGAVVGTMSGTSGTYSANLNLDAVANGAHTVGIRATDSVNNASTATINVTVAHAAPNAPTLSTQLNGTTTRIKDQTITGQAKAGSQVQLYLNGTEAGAAVTAAGNGSFSAPVTLVPGANQIQAKATDQYGTSAFSTTLTITLDITVPVAPTNLTATPQIGGKIRLGWTRSSDVNATSVAVYRAASPFTGIGEALKIATLAATVVSYDDTPAQDGVYYYRLVSVNAVGTPSDVTGQAQAASDSKAPRASVEYTPLGKVDAATGRIGQGKVDIVMTVTEALQAAPYFAVVPNGSAPITVTLARQSDTQYIGSFFIDANTGSGTANALFSARDMIGNRGTELDAGATLKIDTEGPIVNSIAVTPVTPIKNDTAQTIAATFTLSKAMKSGETPQITYLLSGPVRSPIAATGVTAVNPTTWTASFTLPSDAGAGSSETFSFAFRGIDDLDNVSTRIATPNNRFQVYQGELPPLAIPLGLQAKAQPGGKVRLTWLAVEHATSYQIYRQGPADAALLPIEPRATGVEHIDTTAQDGKHLYAVATVREANGQESVSSQSAAVEVTSSANAPGAPQNLSLILVGAGIQATWQAPLNSTVATYNLYRSSATTISSVDGMTPIKTGITQLGTIDASPSPTDRAYVVTALDAAGNESAISNSVYLNFNLLPVATLKVEQLGNNLPQLSWTASKSGNAGYNVYIGPDATRTKLTATPTTGLTFQDTGYTSGERRYTVAVVDSNGVEQPRTITLPNLSIEVVSGMPIKRGVMNRLQVQVTNTSATGFGNVQAVIRINNIDHKSEPFSLGANETKMIPVIVGGYAELQANAAMQVGVEIVPNEGELVKVAKTTAADIADGSLVVGIATEEFTRGATGKVRLTIENTSEVEVELLTALSNGASNSNELRFKILDGDGNVLSTQPYKQVLGANVITLSNGQTVARIAAGASYVSDVFILNVPAAAPNSIRVRLEVDKLRYHTGQPDAVSIGGRSAEKVVSLMDTAYLGEVTDVNPISSYGDQDVIITGRALDRQTMTALPNTRIKLVLNQQGFERIFSVLTDATGSFTYVFKPTITDAGLYKVSAVHPDITDRPEQKAFTINRVTVGPSIYNLDVPKNYPFSIPLQAKAGPGTAATNLRLTLDAASQPTGQIPAGITIKLPAPVNLVEKQTLNVPVVFTANNDAQPTGSLIFNVISDEHAATPLGQVKINYKLSEAKPLLSSTPSLVQTGMAQGGSDIESVTVQNKGLQDALNLQFSLTKADGSAAPAWVSLAGAVNGTLAVGATRVVDIAFNPPTDTPEGVYEFRLVVKGDNVAQQSMNVYASITQSGQGNVLFKTANMYTATIGKDGNLIAGLAGATITVQNEDVATVTHSLVTDTLGEAMFQNLPAGNYKFRATAPNHQEIGGRLQVKPGITFNQPVFLDYNLITVEWSVREITIQDRYEITLNTTFETDVPAAVVVMQPASVNLPAMKAGDVYYGELVLTNFGLVRAQNMKQTLPRSDAYFRFEFLVEVPTVLEPKQRITIPYRVVSLQSLEGGTSGSASGGGCYSYSNTTRVTCESPCANGTVSYNCGAATSWFSASNSTCSGGTGGGGTWVGGGGGWGGGGGFGGGGMSTPVQMKGQKCVYIPNGGGQQCSAK